MPREGSERPIGRCVVSPAGRSHRGDGKAVPGSRIRQLREAARLTQEELATAAGIGRVTLVRIENGEQSPRYETLVALAGALGRPVAELLTLG